jgi:uncharacterized protein YabN with tetrapyrrole methylase and pyrophosphatase domain
MSMQRQGRLIVVGTGISLGQITKEAISWIERADSVLYVVSDAATERFIQTHNPVTENLYDCYSKDKPRISAYKEMVARTVSRVESGQTVCAVYYGHPGIFCFPSHESIHVLRERGYRAEMLPAVSSLDCLFADLGIDPVNGCQIVEATDLLIRRRRVDVNGPVVIWQAGCVGDLGFDIKRL